MRRAPDPSIDFALGAGLRLVDRLEAPHRVLYWENGLRIAHVGSRRSRLLFPGNEGNVVCRHVLSPDGRTVYHAHDQLYAVDIRTGRRRALTTFAAKDRRGVYWDLELTPAGDRLFFKQARTLVENYAHTRVCSVSTDGRGFHVVYEPPGERGGVWAMSCDFAC